MTNKLNIKMYDMAKVRLDSSRIYSGQVTAVYIKGIYIDIHNLGTKYVEWSNILEITEVSK